METDGATHKRPYSQQSSSPSSSIPAKSQRLTGVAEWQEVTNHFASQSGVLTNDRSSKCSLHALPEELLIHIFHHLPWKDRVRLERVSKRWRHLALTHGWADFKHFDSADYGHTNLGVLGMLLDRCGRFVDSISLADISGLEAAGCAGLLEKCPKAGKIALDSSMWMGIGPQLVDYLRERQRCIGIRSLSFTISYSPDSTLLPSLNCLLAECAGTLQSVGITTQACAEALTLVAGLKLPPHLRELSLNNHGFFGREDLLLLSTEALGTLTAGGLHSYRLQQLNPPATLRYLGAAVFARRLTHLGVPVSAANLPSLMSALANMPLLRALELAHHTADGDLKWDSVIRGIATGRPELEHLTLMSPWVPSSSDDSLLRLERLVSLDVQTTWQGRTKVDWEWLMAVVERGRLEHCALSIQHIAPAVICRVVKKRSKSLRYFQLTGKSFTRHECERLMKSSPITGVASILGQKNAPAVPPVLHLYVECNEGYPIVPINYRLRFANTLIKSPVLQRIEKEWRECRRD